MRRPTAVYNYRLTACQAKYLEQDDSNGISNAWGLGLDDDFLMGWNSKPANSTV